jgi:peptide/nickel transport system substrate-binding protein
MTVKLRPGIYWSDGVEFTADDLIYTVETQIKNPGMRWSALLALNVESVSSPEPWTVRFKLKRPNSRFHSLFTVRFNAIWIMPKHIFEKAADPQKFDFNPPVSLGAYKIHSHDPDGKWYIWQKREDWQRTTLGRYGEPGPKFAAYIDPGPPDKRVIAQLNHNLDVVHDVAPEGMFTLSKQSPSLKTWFKNFPFAHPDPTLPSVIFNMQNPAFQNRDVRWALALLIDAKAVSMASYRGAATLSPIGIPPTGTHPDDYHIPLQDWLASYEIDTGKSKVKPYDPNIGNQIADMLRPTMKEQIPTDPAEIRKAFGYGWWKPNPQAAAELLEKAGYTKRGNSWYTPDGKPFSIKLMVEGDSRPILTRAGTMIVQQWRQFGIDAKTEVAQGTMLDRRNAGDFETLISWSVRPMAAIRTCRTSSTAGIPSSSRPQARRSRPATGSVGAIRNSTGLLRRSAGFPSTTSGLSNLAVSTPSSSFAKCRSSRSWRTMSSRPWMKPIGQDTRLRKIPTLIRSRTGVTPAP